MGWQAGLQEPFCPGWGWWLPWRGEAEAVTEAVLVVATWRLLLSCQLLSDVVAVVAVEKDPPLWHVVSMERGGDRGGGLQSAQVLVVAKEREMRL